MGNLLQGAFCFLWDPLSFFFTMVIAIVAIPCAIYSVGYLKAHYAPKKIAYNWVLFILFIASMAAVVIAGNALFFLIVWELMSLVSYFLVIFDQENERSISAGTLYLVMTHIGTAFITAAIVILYAHAGSFDFAQLKAASHSLSASTRHIVFVFFLIGFGTKAGIVPLHLWLPAAHPQAPSHISSLMSGVMIKMAVYGLLRFVVMILGVDSLWWGAAILVLAAVSALTGIIYALMENDLKKVLAYSSVENMGIILFGVGLAFMCFKMNLAPLGVISLAAALYHLINHAIFKGLLFLAAGSVYNATGTRDMEKLGGLIKTMPYTALFFLIGAMSISALPPLNGFVSEWLSLQAFFAAALHASGGVKVFICICAAILALTGGLAAACFVKAFGISFLAMPRSNKSQNAVEVNFPMKLGMGCLSALCVVFGLGAGFIFKLLLPVAGSVAGETSLPAGGIFTVNSIFTSARISPVLIMIAAVVASLGLYYAFRWVYGRNKLRRAVTWDCGYYALTSRNEYSAMAFSKPFRIAFSFFLLPYRKTEKIRDSFYHVTQFKYEVHTTPIFRRYLYEPFFTLIISAAKLMRKLQPGSIHLYISYIFITIVVLIVLIKVF